MTIPSENPKPIWAETEAENEALLQALRDALKRRRAALKKLLKGPKFGGYADRVYRFYSQSFKVFHLQEQTEEIVNELRALLPGRELNAWFLQIIGEGTGHTFEASTNDNWLRQTRPIVEAYFHARFMLDMAVCCANPTATPITMPVVWSAFLTLYYLR